MNTAYYIYMVVGGVSYQLPNSFRTMADLNLTLLPLINKINNFNHSLEIQTESGLVVLFKRDNNIHFLVREQ